MLDGPDALPESFAEMPIVVSSSPCEWFCDYYNQGTLAREDKNLCYLYLQPSPVNVQRVCFTLQGLHHLLRECVMNTKGGVRLSQV